jgi:ABC-type polysaccharide/polyol phosphate export permease
MIVNSRSRRCMTSNAEIIDVAEAGHSAGALSWFGYVVLGISLARIDTRLRYRRTTLGPFWVTLSFGIFVLAVGAVYTHVFGNPTGTKTAGYLPYFAIGMLVWTWAAATITEGCTVFIQSGGLIKTLRVPLLLHVYRMLGRNFIVFAHNALVIVLLWLALRWPLGWSAASALAGILLCLVTLFGVVLVVAILSTRFRDLQQIIGTALQLLFLASPIIWPVASVRGGRAQFLLDYNPVYYMIEVVRGPLLGENPSVATWLVASFIAAASIAMGLVLYTRFRHRIAYWL